MHAPRLVSLSLLAIACLGAGSAPPFLAPGKRTVFTPETSGLIGRISVSAGKFTTVSIDQHDLDISVEVSGPTNGELAQADAFELGTDSVSFIPRSDDIAEIRIRVLKKHAPKASYSLTVEAPREPTPEDSARIEAEKLSSSVKTALDKAPSPNLMPAALRALELWRQTQDRPSIAASMVQIGDAANLIGDAPTAREKYLAALAFSRENHDSLNCTLAANNAGYLELQLGLIEESRQHLEEARRSSEEAHTVYGQMVALNNLGIWFRRTADFGAAQRSNQEALRLTDPTDNKARALLLNNIGMLSLSLGRYDDAAADLNRAVSLLPADDALARGKSLTNLGRAWLLADKPVKASGALASAWNLLQNTRDVQAQGDALSNLGQAAERSGDATSARRYFEQALTSSKNAGDLRGEALADYHLGRVAARNGEEDAASSLFTAARELQERIGLEQDLAETHYALAESARRRGDLTAARDYAAKSLAAVESFRTNIPAADLRSSWFALKQPLYEFYIGLLMDMHRKEPAAGYDRLAFEAFERERARTLLDSLREVRPDIRHGQDPALLTRLTRAEERMNFAAQALNQVLNSPHAADREAARRREFSDAQQAYEALEGEIRAKNPAYAGLAWPQPRTLTEIQKNLLDNGTLLLEYSVGESGSRLWAVTPQSFQSFDLPPAKTLDPLARTVAELAADRKRDAAASARYERAAQSLSVTLLGPVAGLIGSNKVLIVASGNLQRVPFAGLSVPGDKAAVARPLGARNQLTESFSASSLGELRQAHALLARPAKALAVFADPVFDAKDSRVNPAAPARKSPEPFPPLARLSFTRAEALSLLGTVPPEDSLGALGYDAGRTALLDPGLAAYRYVHIATHGLFLDPALPGLMLSRVDKQGRLQNGFLSAPEIYKLRLAGDLVTIPDCDTGIGQDVRGEGLTSLARAFLFAGSSRVLATLWSPDDEATSEVIERVYDNLLKRGGGQTPGAALQQARRELWEKGGRWRDPYFLAGFVLYGEYR
jgi:CHAT domain-containing protein/Tfp pilus assembly protein PilF